MTIAEQYARALFELVEKNPKEGPQYLKNLAHALERRGHCKLLPSVLSAYETITLAAHRAKLHRRITPAQERTRTLLQLYKKLVAAD
jgi:F0F1-type ATP synthase delta subunit